MYNGRSAASIHLSLSVLSLSVLSLSVLSLSPYSLSPYSRPCVQTAVAVAQTPVRPGGIDYDDDMFDVLKLSEDRRAQSAEAAAQVPSPSLPGQIPTYPSLAPICAPNVLEPYSKHTELRGSIHTTLMSHFSVRFYAVAGPGAGAGGREKSPERAKSAEEGRGPSAAGSGGGEAQRGGGGRGRRLARRGGDGAAGLQS